MSATVTERLVSFLKQWDAKDVPEHARNEAIRLLINQLKAAVGATDHEVVRILHEWAKLEHPGSGAHAFWFGTNLSPHGAAVVNGALFEVLDFNDTYIPTFMHATSGMLAAVMAVTEARGLSGERMIKALVLGLEVELACATILMPTGYYRGFVPGGLVGSVGTAAACAVLVDLDEQRTRNALGLAMMSAFGCYESVGSMALPYIVGFTARAGIAAFQLAERGLDAPATAFEGEKGMIASYSDEPASKIGTVLDSLGTTWRIHGQSYKTVPTETITHAPIELVLEILKRAKGRKVDRMRFSVQPIVKKIADERRDRFGNPSSELTARFDLRFCAAAAWVRGRFTLAEMKETAYKNQEILDLRSRIDLIADPARKTFDGAALEIVFADGSTESANVDDFLGTPGNPMSNEQLSDLFRRSAEGLLPAERADAILDAAWKLESAPNIRQFVSLLKLK